MRERERDVYIYIYVYIYIRGVPPDPGGDPKIKSFRFL